MTHETCKNGLVKCRPLVHHFEGRELDFLQQRMLTILLASRIRVLKPLYPI